MRKAMRFSVTLDDFVHTPSAPRLFELVLQSFAIFATRVVRCAMPWSAIIEPVVGLPFIIPVDAFIRLSGNSVAVCTIMRLVVMDSTLEKALPTGV
jgi:hypothetical protein